MYGYTKIKYSNVPPCDYIFARPEDAKRTLDGLKNIISMYGVATVADLKDLIGHESRYADNKYGWTSSDRMVVRMLDYYNPNKGYLLHMPTPIPLESDSDVTDPGSDGKVKLKFKPALTRAAKDAKIQKAYNVLTRALFNKEFDEDDLACAMEEAIGYLGEVLE